MLELIVNIVDNFDRINKLIGISKIDDAERISYNQKLVKYKKNLVERIVLKNFERK